MQIVRSVGLVATLIVAVAAIDRPAGAQSVEDFYKGRDVKIVIPAGMGGSFGLYSQFVAKHLGKHIPGNPNFIVQGMPGAGGLKALTYVYTAAPKDGSVLTFPHSGVVFNYLLNPDVKFDARKFQYLGRMVSTDFVGMLHKRVGVNKLEELKTKRVVFGATGLSNTTALTAAMFNRIVGTKIKIITGYKGVARIFQAIDQKELDGVSATVTNPHYLAFRKKVAAGQPTDFIAIYTTAPKRIPLYPDAPSLFEYEASEDDKRVLAIIGSDGLVGRSLAFPPDVPKAFVDAFRKGFDALAKDQAFLKEAEERGIPLDIMSGEEHFKRIVEVIDAVPPATRKDAAATYQDILKGIEQ